MRAQARRGRVATHTFHLERERLERRERRRGEGGQVEEVGCPGVRDRRHEQLRERGFDEGSPYDLTLSTLTTSSEPFHLSSELSHVSALARQPDVVSLEPSTTVATSAVCAPRKIAMAREMSATSTPTTRVRRLWSLTRLSSLAWR